VNEGIVGAHAALADGHDLELQATRLDPQRFLHVLAEEQGLPVLDVDLAIGGEGPVGELGEGAVVEYDAVLEDFDERGAVVLFRALEHSDQVLLQRVDRAGDEACANPERKRASG
jgi:hypothetical protein